MSFFDSHRSGDLVNVLASDVSAVTTALSGDTLATALKSSIQLVGSLGTIVVAQNPKPSSSSTDFLCV